MSFQYRTLSRDGYCRVCNDIVGKNSERVITFRSSRENVVICSWCVSELKKAVEGVEDSE